METPKRFRKKPLVVEAVRVTEANIEWVEKWCRGSIKGILLPKIEQVIDIQTLEGEMRANIGDVIIKGIQGEFYPCRFDIFLASYEEVK